MAKNQIPVYLFTGFLEAGKTKMIQETLEDPNFSKTEHILLLVCEEGVEEYDPTRFSSPNVRMLSLDSESQLDVDMLTEYCYNHKVERVLVEYNGMWQLNALYENLPPNWYIFQQLLFADATTILNYNANMRSLVVDKLQDAEMVIFNRSEGADKMALHKLVRGISRRANIAYENAEGELEHDEIEDPLPFDVNAPVIAIDDRDYAIWYRDLTEEFPNYHGKTVKLKVMVARDGELGKKSAVVGRHVMTCCADDISFEGLVCNFGREVNFATRDWIVLTAKIRVERHKLYGQEGPVLYATDVALTTPPAEELATFY